MGKTNQITGEKTTQLCQVKVFATTLGGTRPEHLPSLLGLPSGHTFSIYWVLAVCLGLG